MKIEIRAHSSIVKESRTADNFCLANERVVEQRIELVLGVVVAGTLWYLRVVLLCTSLIISNAEHLFMCLQAICTSSSEKCLFRSCAHFQLDCLLFDAFELYGQEDPLEEEMVTHSSILAWKNSMIRGAWQATVHRVTKIQTQLSD